MEWHFFVILTKYFKNKEKVWKVQYIPSSKTYTGMVIRCQNETFECLNRENFIWNRSVCKENTSKFLFSFKTSILNVKLTRILLQNVISYPNPDSMHVLEQNGNFVLKVKKLSLSSSWRIKIKIYFELLCW